MRALRFIDHTLSLSEVPLPAAGSEALVRVSLSGICNTDLEIVRGYAGFEGTIGHEFVGIVEESAEAPHLVGKRVVGEINAGCNECPSCLAGDPRHCPRRTVLGIVGRDGAHAEFLNLPSRNLFIVPDAVADERAVFTEPLAAANGIHEQVDVTRDDRVAVVGDGKLGLLCAMTMALKSDNVTIVGKHRDKMALADDICRDIKMKDDVDDELHRGFDVVIEASGSESGFATALDLVRPRGTVVLKSTFHGTPKWDAARVVVDEITIVGSRCGRFTPALELLENAAVPVERLITRILPLSEGLQGMRRAAEPGVLKILLDPSK
jgi:threonine dehydrogenase-like Zn-dependent dehydrogenase